MSLITILASDDSVPPIIIGRTGTINRGRIVGGASVELRRVAFDALPAIDFDIGIKLSDSFSDIKLDVRLGSGIRLPIRSMIVDDDPKGLFHFEFDQDEIPPGRHIADLIFYNIDDPTKTFTIPDEEPIVIIARERI